MTEIIDRIQTIRQHPAVRIGTTVLWILLILPFLIYAFPMVAGAEGSFIVLSGSMEPTISPGDVVIVNEVDPGEINQGDVITFRRSGEDIPTTHRVVEVQESDGGVQFITKGDNNEGPDTAPVSGEQVAGRVPSLDVPRYGTLLFVIPYIGHVLQAFGTTTGFLLLFVLPFVILLGAEVWSFARTTSGKDSDESGESDTGASEGSVTRARTDTDADEPLSTDEEGQSEDAEEDAGTYTFTMSELRLSIVVLAVFLAYSLFVARELMTLWSIMVSAGISMTTLLVGAVYVFADTVDEQEGSSGAPPGDGGDHPGGGVGPPDASGGAPIEPAPGTIPPESELGTTVTIDGLDALVDVARAEGRGIVRDGGTYAVLGGDVTYLHVAETGLPPDDPASGQDHSEDAGPEQESPDDPAPSRAPQNGSTPEDTPGNPPAASTGESTDIQWTPGEAPEEGPERQPDDAEETEGSKADDD